MCCFPIHPGRETPKSDIFRERSAFWSLEIKEMRCKSSCDCLGLRNICLLFVLHFAMNTVLLSPSYSLPVCCCCLNHNQQILIRLNFTLREECEAKFLHVSRGLWSPQYESSSKAQHCLRLGARLKLGSSAAEENPAVLKWRRDISTEERIYIQVRKVVIQLLWLPGFY